MVPIIVEMLMRSGPPLRWQLLYSTERDLPILILSSSRIARQPIKALASPSKNQISVNSCHVALNLLGALNTVSVAWSPGHSGIPGNGLADETEKGKSCVDNNDSSAHYPCILSTL
uniref:RNase H type-1 domain-containing protein n=1 Tax=Rhodnius prolixus TaxID=13249 RepID=T1I0U8_RHOPR